MNLVKPWSPVLGRSSFRCFLCFQIHFGRRKGRLGGIFCLRFFQGTFRHQLGRCPEAVVTVDIAKQGVSAAALFGHGLGQKGQCSDILSPSPNSKYIVKASQEPSNYRTSITSEKLLYNNYY